MSRLKSYARKFEKGGKETYRVICLDQADIQAAEQLGIVLTTEILQGKVMKIAFTSGDKDEAMKLHETLNKAAQLIRTPKGTDPFVAGVETKKQKQINHQEHQTRLQEYRNARTKYKAENRSRCY